MNSRKQWKTKYGLENINKSKMKGLDIELFNFNAGNEGLRWFEILGINGRYLVSIFVQRFYYTEPLAPQVYRVDYEFLFGLIKFKVKRNGGLQ